MNSDGVINEKDIPLAENKDIRNFISNLLNSADEEENIKIVDVEFQPQKSGATMQNDRCCQCDESFYGIYLGIKDMLEGKEVQFNRKNC